MVIKHNLLAMNAQRQLGINRGKKAKDMEKLASGYKINRAADDAAGLAISEKMRRKIRGLTQGVMNAQEGVSVCQVADSALVEISEMLHRISELAVKSANETNTGEDRSYIQQEVSQLIQEIDHIAETTSFNEILLLNGLGTFDGKISNVLKPSTDGDFFKLFGDHISKTGYMVEELTPGDVTDSTSVLDTSHPYVSVHINMGSIPNMKDLVGTTFFVNCCTDCCPTTVEFTDTVGVKSIVGKIQIGMKKADGSYFGASEFCQYVVASLKGQDPNHVKFAYKGSMLYIYDIDNNNWNQDEKEAAYFCDSKEIFGNINQAGERIWIQSGNEPGDGIWLQLGNASAAGLGMKGVNVSTVSGAKNAIEVSKSALSKLMLKRSRIGAQQSRLEHTIDNENNIVENLTAAESRIRDADMAKEMVKLSVHNILEQAGVSMLAQANQSKQQILGLLG